MRPVSENAASPHSTLVIVRHAHTEMAGRFCGSSDPPLSQQGLTQLELLNRKLAAYPLARIFSSDLQRARQTAEFISRRRGLQVTHLELLRELAFGSWEGLDWDQVVARDAAYAQRWLEGYPFVPAPGGEDFQDFSQRVQHAMTTIAEQVQGGCAAVVTHAGVIRTFLGSVARLQGVPMDFAHCDYASCWEVRCDAGRWYLPVAATVAQEANFQAGCPV